MCIYVAVQSAKCTRIESERRLDGRHHPVQASLRVGANGRTLKLDSTGFQSKDELYSSWVNVKSEDVWQTYLRSAVWHE
jgi:hypothetical protein